MLECWSFLKFWVWAKIIHSHTNREAMVRSWIPHLVEKIMNREGKKRHDLFCLFQFQLYLESRALIGTPKTEQIISEFNRKISWAIKTQN